MLLNVEGVNINVVLVWKRMANKDAALLKAGQ